MKGCRLKRVIFLTFDVEPDAPPYQSQSDLGIRDGLPWILDFLRETGVKATFFVTASLVEASREFEELVNNIVDDGHEIGSHGLDHSRLDRLPLGEAMRHIRESIKILSSYSKIHSFRAPNLQLPERLLNVLIEEGIRVDSSVASYKAGRVTEPFWYSDRLLRVPVTSTSSTIRLPEPLAVRATLPGKRDFYSLFYHPWEFVKIRRRPIYRPDIWFRTGGYARRMLARIVRYAVSSGFRFALMREAPRLCSI